MPIDKTANTEFAALKMLSKANKRANIILVCLFIILLVSALVGGISLYNAQRKSFENLNASRLKASNHNLAEIRTMTIENIRYETCIQVVQIAQRTPKAQRECFKRADLPGGLSEKDFVTVPPEIAVSAVGNAIPSQGVSSTSSPGKTSTASSASSPKSSSTSHKPTPPPTPVQPVIPQPVKVLGVPVCIPFTGICVKN